MFKRNAMFQIQDIHFMNDLKISLMPKLKYFYR
jgi:hypothetical protein